MNIGIDKIGFYTPNYVVNMEDLASARGVEPAKYTIGLGQERMSLVPATQDIVTMAANAAQPILTTEDKETIEMVLFGTETGVDHSKSAAVSLQRLLNLSHRIRCVELKHACYGATAALQLAKSYIMTKPGAKVLVIASDIAKYGLNSGGEPTQGAGAIAMLVSADPHILVLEDQTSLFSDDVMDFWRPTYAKYPMVDGKFSNEQYVRCFNEVWKDACHQTGLTLSDYAALCFHLPYSKMGLKALRPLLEDETDEVKDYYLARYQESAQYSKQVGNIYTGSLFLALISLLENSETLKAGDRIGMYSYGSGAVAEFFSGQLVEGYQEYLLAERNWQMLATRQVLSIPEYEEVFSRGLIDDLAEQEVGDDFDRSSYILVGTQNHIRQYKHQ